MPKQCCDGLKSWAEVEHNRIQNVVKSDAQTFTLSPLPSCTTRCGTKEAEPITLSGLTENNKRQAVENKKAEIVDRLTRCYNEVYNSNNDARIDSLYRGYNKRCSEKFLVVDKECCNEVFKWHTNETNRVNEIKASLKDNLSLTPFEHRCAPECKLKTLNLTLENGTIDEKSVQAKSFLKTQAAELARCYDKQLENAQYSYDSPFYTPSPSTSPGRTKPTQTNTPSPSSSPGRTKPTQTNTPSPSSSPGRTKPTQTNTPTRSTKRPSPKTVSIEYIGGGLAILSSCCVCFVLVLMLQRR